jgi:crotonobetainyl-CoA:carnitine CoA-transferase CaiB-like acyl-CoA transferase
MPHPDQPDQSDQSDQSDQPDQPDLGQLPEGALTGLRVLDFSWSVAGPIMTRNLASLGAEVIKVEWPGHADPMRPALYAKDVERRGWNNGAFFADLNVGKRSLTLNARDPEGFEIAKALMRTSDVVVESFSSRVFEKWGFSPEVVAETNPRIVYTSMSGFGHSGPYRDRDTWGPTAQAYNGLTFMSGLPGIEPAGWGWSYMDLAAGYLATVATLAAVLEADTSGRGQYVDVAQVEAGIVLNGASLLDASVNGRGSRRVDSPPGNRAVWSDPRTPGHRGEVGAPYGVFPTRGGGYNDFVAISVLDDAQWTALVEVLGRPAWASDSTMTTVEGRVAAQDALEKHLTEWTLRHEKYEVMTLLQRAGVPAGAVQSAEDRMDHDEHLGARGIWPRLTHPEIGEARFQGAPFQLSDTPLRTEARWPVLGADTAEVLGELLGYDAAKVADLDRRGITWPVGTPRDVEFAQPLW